jgi:hypothetical protein
MKPEDLQKDRRVPPRKEVFLAANLTTNAKR